jgi:cytoskeletal protein CcmA (bactofilin family)
MFHRIKSESQPEQASHTENAPANAPVNESPANEAPAPVESPAASQPETLDIETYAQQSQAEEKTTETTTEQAQDTIDTQTKKDDSSMTNTAPTNTQAQPETQEDSQPYRAPNAPAAGGYAYTSNFSAPNAKAEAEEKQEEPAPQTSGQNRQLVIGHGITMSGEIEACDNLVVEGTVEASLKGASVLTIAETGTFYGAVEIENATISGRFEGDIAVTGRLTISETGQVTGSIAYGELQMEAGAIIDGKLTPMKHMATASQRAPQQVAANSEDAQLFAKA